VSGVERVFFRIGEAAQLVGVEPHVLRYWETEFKMRTPRSDTGQRLYRHEDLSRFQRIKRLLHDEGFTIVGARKALEDDGADEVSPPVRRADDLLSRVDEARLRIARLRQRVRAIAGASGSE
jgi:DNA-binding transcriptional MerR regulator